ncbi:MAG: hypothetical protein OXU45_08345 [Candidatus Melainabacteria bacterium]|nr:hypothetical protein [Candidatus Melainabacteria bacterium]
MSISYSIDLEDFVATVDASRTVLDFDQELAEHGLVSSLHAPKDLTISEALAQDWGHNARQVLGLYLEHADGTQSKTGGKVIKNVSGYDLAKLYIGSCNQLAKIIAASLRLELLPKFQTEIKVSIEDLCPSTVIASPQRGFTKAKQSRTSRSASSGLLRLGKPPLGARNDQPTSSGLEEAVLIAYDLSTRDFDDTCTPVIRPGELKFKLAAVKEELLELKVKRLCMRLGDPDLAQEALLRMTAYSKHYPKSDTRVELHAALTELAAIAQNLDRTWMILPKQGHILLDGCTEDIESEQALVYKYPLSIAQEAGNRELEFLNQLQEQYRGHACAN